MSESYQGNWTEYFSQFCTRHADEENALFGVLSNMPDDLNNVPFKTRFKQRNWHKEIGSETEELFMMQMAVKFDEVINRYAFKIQSYHNNIANIMKRYESVTVADSDVKTGTDSSNGKTNEFYNPVNDNSSSVLVGKDTSESSVTFGNTKTMNRTRILQFAYNTDNAALIKGVNDLDSVYEEALEYLDRLFMVVL